LSDADRRVRRKSVDYRITAGNEKSSPCAAAGLNRAARLPITLQMRCSRCR